MSITPQTLIEQCDVSRTHAYDIVAGREEPSVGLALKIYDVTGAQYGILKGLSQAAIDELRKQAA